MKRLLVAPWTPWIPALQVEAGRSLFLGGFFPPREIQAWKESRRGDGAEYHEYHPGMSLQAVPGRTAGNATGLPDWAAGLAAPGPLLWSAAAGSGQRPDHVCHRDPPSHGRPSPVWIVGPPHRPSGRAPGVHVVPDRLRHDQWGSPDERTPRAGSRIPVSPAEPDYGHPRRVDCRPGVKADTCQPEGQSASPTHERL